MFCLDKITFSWTKFNMTFSDIKLGVSYPGSLAAGDPSVNVATTLRTKHKFYIQNCNDRVFL